MTALGGAAVDHVSLGQSGLKVSQACLGTANFGTEWGFGASEETARSIIDAFLDAGNNFVDTAGTYQDGRSEEIVGRAIRGKRDSVVIATKAAMPTGPGPNDSGLSRIHLTRALETSLRRLGTDHVDVFHCHTWDPDTPIGETVSTLDDFVRSGKVRYLGLSNFTASQIVEAQWAVERAHGTPFIACQSQYSLMARAIEAEILPACGRHGLGMVAWSPLGGGVLAGRYRRDGDPAPGTRLGALLAGDLPGVREFAAEQLRDANLTIAAEIGTIAAELETTPAAVALAWVRRRPGVTAVIIGPRTVAQYEQNLAGFTLDLPAHAAARLDAISGPPPQPVSGSTGRRWLRTRRPARGRAPV